MAPKKKEQQKMSLGDFLTDNGGGYGGGSWADEVEETYVTGTQPLPSGDRARTSTSAWQDRGYSVREAAPQQIPTKPPYTAHLGNLSYDATVETVTEFFEGCDVASVRIIEDREMQRPKGFGYVEFSTVEGLKKALTLDAESFQGRMIKIKVADPPRGGLERDPTRGDSIREMGNWTRTGPLADAPGRVARQNSDFGERRAPRERDSAAEPKPNRDFNWERRGPLSPLPQESPRAPPEGLGERSESHRGSRQAAPSWGEGRPEGSRPRREPTDRPERPERPERVPTAADKDMQWRDRMRPDAPVKSPEPTPDSTPASPVPQAAAPVPGQRPKLNLAKRTVSEAPEVASPSAPDSKASPFGGARPINTAAREKEIEEKRLQAIQEKKDADDKAKEERRVAKEAAAAEAAAAKEAPTVEAAKEGAEEAKPEDEAPAAAAEEENGTTETKAPIRNRESKENANPKSRPFDTGNWRSASYEQRGPRGGARGGRGGGRGDRQDRGDERRGSRQEPRGPRANGPPREQEGDEAPSQDDDGWTTVPKKGRQGKPLVS